MSKKLIFMMLLVVGMATTSHAQTNADAILGEWINEEKDTKFQIFKKNNKMIIKRTNYLCFIVFKQCFRKIWILQQENGYIIIGSCTRFSCFLK